MMRWLLHYLLPVYHNDRFPDFITNYPHPKVIMGQTRKRENFTYPPIMPTCGCHLLYSNELKSSLKITAPGIRWVGRHEAHLGRAEGRQREENRV
ncbi:hypothetical protein PoB_002741400 [Plakobranchus ocellatus]|uniref:Uncharacterized protein n=1 Tax=Plakobranchus ocellatus TaxID=259542 RepID=A0AAV4A2V0_9GAST|nr:hypothetical protein PoB_002741400 [Plakobranchus ocellatus]